MVFHGIYYKTYRTWRLWLWRSASNLRLEGLPFSHLLHIGIMLSLQGQYPTQRGVCILSPSMFPDLVLAEALLAPIQRRVRFAGTVPFKAWLTCLGGLHEV